MKFGAKVIDAFNAKKSSQSQSQSTTRIVLSPSKWNEIEGKDEEDDTLCLR